MPARRDYVRDLGIPKTYEVVDGWKIHKSQTSEEVVEKFKRYKFVTYVEAEQVRKRNVGLQEALGRRVTGEATVLSPYGNAYICKTTIQVRKATNRLVQANIVGECRRIRNGKGRPKGH